MGEIMGFLDKVKNLFTEPEDGEDEIEIEQIEKKVPKKVSEPKKVVEKKREKNIDLEETKEFNNSFEEEKTIKIEREREKSHEKEYDFEDKSVEPEVKEEPKETVTREKVKTPIFFTENDFADLEPEKPKKVEKKKEPEYRAVNKREEKKHPYSGSYTSTSILTTEKPTFKPTPIISPIYGILDKNYSKEDIVERKESKDGNNIIKGSVDKFDQVRNKAYGKLENDLEETIYEESKRKKNRIEEEIDLFDELENENKKVEPVKVKETSNLAKSVNEQEKNIRELEEVTMDLTKELDNLLLQRESYNQKKEKIERESNNGEELLTENELFNIIDSIYEEGKE